MTLSWVLLVLQTLIFAGTLYDVWLHRCIIAAQTEVIAMHEHHIAQHTRFEKVLDIDQQVNQ